METTAESRKHWYHTGFAKWTGILLCTVSGILLFCSLLGIILVLDMNLVSLDPAEVKQRGFSLVGDNYACEILETCTTNDEKLDAALGAPAVVIRNGAGETDAPADADPASSSAAVGGRDSAVPDLASYSDSALEFGILRFSIPMTDDTRYYNIEPEENEFDLDDESLYFYRSPGFSHTSGDSVRFAPAGSWFMYSTGSAASMLLRGSYATYLPSDQAEYYDHEPGELRTWYGIVYRVDTEAAKTAGALPSAPPSRRMAAAFREMNSLMELISFYVQYSVLLLAVSLAGFILSYVLCLTAAGHRRGTAEVRRRFTDRIPYEVILGAAAGGISIMIMLGAGAGSSLLRYRTEGSGSNLLYLSEILLLLAVLCMLLGIFASMTTAVRIKTRTFWRSTLAVWILRPIVWLWKKLLAGLRAAGRGLRTLCTAVTENVGLTVRVIIFLCVLTFLEILGILITGYDDPGLEVALLFLAKFVSVPLIIWGVAQFERIRTGAHRITEGQVDTPVDTKWMYPGFKDVATDINRAGEGIRNAVSEQLKSERMKTELITNVSHDIKTPLTSIINYVDLLQKENIDNPQAAEYLTVLDRQSSKLKKLIEDLLEASKAATGNIEMNVAPCDLHLVLSQAMGEFEDRLAAASVTPVISGPDHVQIRADARYLWRVFDNLLGNVCKYAMPGTRLYIDLKEKTDSVVASFKNISSSPLNISGEELMERFVQGDRSRNTEGSGLGLSISNSLVSLMGGQMDVDCDGDLFKVTLAFQKSEG